MDLEVKGALASIVSSHFQRVLYESPKLLVSSTIEFESYKDTSELLGDVLNLLRVGDRRESLVADRLASVRQHYNLLRHSPLRVSTAHLLKAMQDFDALIAVFAELSEEYPEKKFFLQLFTDLASQYGAICRSAGVATPPGEEPPNLKTLRWYKANAWKDFISERDIRIEKGRFKGKTCKVKKWDGNTVVCLFSDGEEHCVSVTNIVSFV